MSEQFRERVSEFEVKVKRLEGERQRMDLEHSRVIREKEGQNDLVRNQNMGLT